MPNPNKSPIWKLESAWRILLQGSQPIQNISISDDTSEIVHPAILCFATSFEEQISPGSGVFKAQMNVVLEAKVHDTTADEMSAMWEQLTQAFYWDGSLDQSLATRLTASLVNFHVYGVLRPHFRQDEIQPEDTVWRKHCSVDCFFMARDNS